jgi:hypothetical protein
MANLSVEEPYALMRARTGLWEPWWVTARATRPDARKGTGSGVQETKDNAHPSTRRLHDGHCSRSPLL